MMHGMSVGRAPNSYELAVKQAEVEFRGNTLIQSDEPRQILMGAVSRTVEIQGNRIGDVLSTVSLFLDRFFGPQPDPATAAGVPTPQPVGMIQEVERNLSRVDHLLCELEQKIRRLGDIA